MLQASLARIVPLVAWVLLDDVVATTQKVYSGRVEMGTDLTVIDVGDSINVRRPK